MIMPNNMTMCEVIETPLTGFIHQIKVINWSDLCQLHQSCSAFRQDFSMKTVHMSIKTWKKKDNYIFKHCFLSLFCCKNKQILYSLLCVYKPTQWHLKSCDLSCAVTLLVDDHIATPKRPQQPPHQHSKLLSNHLATPRTPSQPPGNNQNILTTT